MLCLSNPYALTPDLNTVNHLAWVCGFPPSLFDSLSFANSIRILNGLRGLGTCRDSCATNYYEPIQLEFKLRLTHTHTQ